MISEVDVGGSQLCEIVNVSNRPNPRICNTNEILEEFPRRIGKNFPLSLPTGTYHR